MKRKGTQMVRGRFAKPVGRSRREGSNPSPSSIRRRLAQLRRAPVLQTGGRRFDSMVPDQMDGRWCMGEHSVLIKRQAGFESLTPNQ